MGPASFPTAPGAELRWTGAGEPPTLTSKLPCPLARNRECFRPVQPLPAPWQSQGIDGAGSATDWCGHLLHCRHPPPPPPPPPLVGTTTAPTTAPAAWPGASSRSRRRRRPCTACGKRSRSTRRCALRPSPPAAARRRSRCAGRPCTGTRRFCACWHCMASDARG